MGPPARVPEPAPAAGEVSGHGPYVPEVEAWAPQLRVARTVVRDLRGAVACVVETRESEPEATVLIRVPGTPPAGLLQRLAQSDREFTGRPVRVALVPADGSPVDAATPRSVAETFEYPVLDGRVSATPYARVTYQRAALRAGIDIVAQRTAPAADGARLVSETRCRLTEPPAGDLKDEPAATPDLEGAGPFVPDLVIDEVPVQTTAALTVTLTGTGSGTVTSSPASVSCTGGFGVACSASFATGTTVTLSAAPAPGSTFAGWGGACSGMAACTVPLASARLVVATFTVPPPWVTQYHHTDALGSVRAVTDATGAVVRTHDYHPFGEGVGAAVDTDPVRFTGKPRDVEAGLDYFGARYYAQGAGRFTTVDPVMLLDRNLADPQSWNRYAYAKNNPQRYVDRDGRIWETLWDVGKPDLQRLQVSQRQRL